ncbi:MAG TPA: sortase, partial [Candidatus Saccharibacteria bacterium]|nr:sortase [Candidatus Saccharibacteria bacterium]
QPSDAAQTPASTTPPPTSRDAALNVMRNTIDKIYDEPQPNEQIAAQVNQVSSSSTDPYNQTHSTATDAQAAIDSEAVKKHWEQYHTQWQQYYQMYYERYYQAMAKQQQQSSSTTATQPQTIKTPETETLTEQEATNELRSELMGKIKQQSSKIRSNRHFKPVLVALSVALLFGFLQFNQLLFASVLAFAVPASNSSSSSYIDPSTDVVVSNDPVLKIPQVNVEAPIDFSLNPLEESVVQSKLKNGVVHYPIAGANARPGEIGNTVILGHSANDVFDDGAYKFVFLHLDRLAIGDTFYIHYAGKRYTYSITEKKVVDPSEVSSLALNNGKPMATLVTCTPPGTALKRLLVIGEQIAPDPAEAIQTPTDSSEQSDRST